MHEAGMQLGYVSSGALLLDESVFKGGHFGIIIVFVFQTRRSHCSQH